MEAKSYTAAYTVGKCGCRSGTSSTEHNALIRAPRSVWSLVISGRRRLWRLHIRALSNPKRKSEWRAWSPVQIFWHKSRPNTGSSGQNTANQRRQDKVAHTAKKKKIITIRSQTVDLTSGRLGSPNPAMGETAVTIKWIEQLDSCRCCSPHAHTHAPHRTAQVSFEALWRTELLRLLTPLPRIRGEKVQFVFVDFWELWKKTKVRRAVKVHRWLALWRASWFPGAPATNKSSRCCATAEIWEHFFANSILRVVKISLASSCVGSFLPPLLFNSPPLETQNI